MMKKIKIEYQKCLSFIKLPDGRVKEVSLSKALEYGRQMKDADAQIDKLIN
jgi:hypothetical protein